MLLLGISGCRSAGDTFSTEREIEELRYENARKRESIIDGLADAERTRRALSETETERSALAKQAADLGASLRTATTELASITAQRDELRTKVADGEKSSEKLNQSLEKVRSVASASAGELADLRLKNQEFDVSLKQLKQNQGSLSEENKKLTKESEDLREELVRTRAVLRSIRDGAPDKAGLAALEEQVQLLQRRNADLQGENVALQKRIESLGAVSTNASAGGADVAVTGSAGSSRTAEGVLWEVGGLVKERYEGVLEGRFRGDSFDWILVGVAIVLVLFLYWVAIRWLRTRRLKKQVRTLTAKVVELESGAASRGDGAEGSKAGSIRADASSRMRKSPSIRRSGFAAVISNKEVQGAAPPSGRPAEGSRRVERATPVAANEDRVLASVLQGGGEKPGRAPPPRARESEGPRKVIGGHLWGEEPDAPQDELAHTQIINKVTVDDHAVEPLPLIPPKGAAGPVSDPLRGSASSRPKKDASEGEDLELLQELKAVINKKFDELMK